MGDREARVQRWIRCPMCGSDDARLLNWVADQNSTLRCPDCDSSEWEANLVETPVSIELVYGDDGGETE
jgi:Zn finger protein HypA/HybF involved in hydrogenase expression